MRRTWWLGMALRLSALLIVAWAAPASAQTVAPPAEGTRLAMMRQARPGPTERARHFSVGAGFAPAVMVDVDYKRFYALFNFSTVVAQASAGRSFSLALAVGTSFRVSPQSRWSLELFAHYTPIIGFSSSSTVHGFGVGFGAHYTLPSGVTIGLRAPVIGYAIETRSFGESRGLDPGEAVALYYLSSVAGLPVVSFGYRF